MWVRDLFAGQQHLLYGAIHNSCKPSVKHRYSCFTTLSGGRCPPHSPPAREITSPNGRPSPLSLRDISPQCGESPLTPECRLRRFFIIYLKVNAVALIRISPERSTPPLCVPLSGDIINYKEIAINRLSSSDNLHMSCFRLSSYRSRLSATCRSL